MDYQIITDDVIIGTGTKVYSFVNLYGCQIGENSKIGTFVEIQKGAYIGKNCKISSHSFICEGVRIDDNCFIGHGVKFINDKNPRSVRPDGQMESDADWKDRFLLTHVGCNVSIGTNSTILGGITIGDNALIGAGSVVTKDVPPGEVWVGNPANKMRKNNNEG